MNMKKTADERRSFEELKPSNPPKPRAEESLVERSQRERFKMYIHIDIEIDFAYTLGNFILDTDTTNPALLAFAHQLVGK